MSVVYKYLQPDREEVLKSGLIRFTQASALNDPFESTPCLHELRQYLWDLAYRRINDYRHMGMAAVEAGLLASLSIRDRLKQFQIDNSNNYAFLSVSETRNNLLMWAHYCASHRGFVVGFDSTHPFFHTQRYKQFSVLHKVRYSRDRPVVPGLQEEWDKLGEIIMLTKSEDWSYERELRMIANPEAADDVKQISGENVYLYRFPTESVKELIFGCRISGDLRERLIDVVDARYDNVQLLSARKSDSRFDLDIEPFQKLN